VKFSFKDSDPSGKRLKAISAQLKGKPNVKVGVFGDSAKARDDGIDTVKLAAIHEFGAPSVGVPERSYIRSTYDANKAKYDATLDKVLKGVLIGRFSVYTGLGILGAQMHADVLATIRAHIAPPLKPATIRRKGSTTPLIDTGQLVASITWRVQAPDSAKEVVRAP
jgi:phage gpG-like protein